MDKKEARERREQIVILLYINRMEGDFDESAYDADILRTYRDVVAHLDDIDKVIEKNLVNWTIDRLNYVDLSIIRYAVYEMKYAKLPYEIAINEALELTKKLSNLDDDLAKGFNNRLLDNIKKDLYR